MCQAGALNTCDTHTWHTIISNEGNWKATLQVINQMEHAWFTDQSCSRIHSLGVSPMNLAQFGFGFDSQADFDVAYTLTLVQDKNPATSHFTSKACVFVITAKGPANPDVAVNSYHGAKCDWKVVKGKGEDFYVG
ncbi:MAG: hypothetical protein A3E83_07335 [Gammaproteobacteria bacterium RIFCSPHIGHO2_12_FULL_41_20]|nr:MAG: hypothetical protein A3E83_07335 [Gammaproteobacteria bacterium RIFCSPHIGHO2_12_FULL_41_20]